MKNMVYKNFRFNVIIRILLIAIGIGSLLYFVIITEQYLRSIYIFIFIVLAIIEFIWYVDKTNRDFSSFLLAIMQDDFSTTFSEKRKGKSFARLYGALNKITQKFKYISSEKEVQFLYLETLVEHVKVGLISFDGDGKIQLMNGAAKNLLNLPVLSNIKGLERIDKDLLKVILSIKSTENKLVKVTINHKLLQLAVHASEFKLKDTYYKLVSLQNIQNELEAHELEAWQKLIKVLTHEIMNSVTPITSLTATLQDILSKEKENIEDGNSWYSNLSQGLDAIKNRSEGLQTFTEAYKNLTGIPLPCFKKININKLITRVQTLFSKTAEENQIKFTIEINTSKLEILVDEDLFGQVLINIVQNALHAVGNISHPRVKIIVNDAPNQRISFTIEDNGAGIEKDKLDKIFIPFFTTKKGGSGIGLALSRQIIQMHNGNISVISKPGEGAAFNIIV